MGKYIFLIGMMLFAWQGHAANEALGDVDTRARARTGTLVPSSDIGLPLWGEEEERPLRPTATRSSGSKVDMVSNLRRLWGEIIREYASAGMSVAFSLLSPTVLLESIPVIVMATNHPWLALRMGGLIVTDPLLRVLAEEYRTIYKSSLPALDSINMFLQATGTGLMLWAIGDWLTGKERSLGTWGKAVLAIGLLDPILTHYKSWSDGLREKTSNYIRYQNWINPLECLVILVFLAIIDSICFC